MVVAGGSPTFSNGAAIFNGAQSIKTATPLSIATDKVTISFRIKSTQTATGIIVEQSSDSYVNGGFMVVNGSNFDIFDSESQQNNEKYISLDLSSFTYCAITIDRSISESIKLYVNGVKVTLVDYSSADLNGNFLDEIIFIGQRNGSTLPFVGELKNFKLYNRVLSQQEIQNLMV
ncbi:hypothetical protein BA768_01150 [Chryseobacterium sp. CBo1]|uniref:LamG domain-containing protein n=1 Tax=Chryseobacterium sp. CBo1 TaxID=1869230 RepID=UPI000810B33A|nr:LamG domain-containing protein [Chryseobacterium sp. CBo1]OCK53191.1 hypothetical protein BA768_01150 [Chryseobacterium sp. CBo1]